MFRWLGSKLGRGRGGAAAPAVDLPSIGRESVAHLLRTREGLPQVDWGAAEAWARGAGAAQVRVRGDHASDADVRRAIAAAWLDELRDALSVDHRRWRSASVEGLAPMHENLALRIAQAADRSVDVITKALRPIRGEAPIPPFAVIGMGSSEDYYSFKAHFHEEEGEWATSSGTYIDGGEDAFPLLVLEVKRGWAAEDTVAHELTHHALNGLNLPLWAEEGLTQMMEERVTGRCFFHIDREMIQRHRGLWSKPGILERFWVAESFSSPEGEEQELSYHLSQMVVRGLLSREPQAFFAFARACAETGPEAAAAEHLSTLLDKLVEGMLGTGERVEE